MYLLIVKSLNCMGRDREDGESKTYVMFYFFKPKSGSCSKCQSHLLQTVKRPKVIQIPITTRPTRAQSSSNLLAEDPNHRRPRRGSDTGSYGRDPRRGRSASPERNGHDLALMSGFKRLPQQDAADKPIRTTLIKKKQTDGEGTGGAFSYCREEQKWILLSLKMCFCSRDGH